MEYSTWFYYPRAPPCLLWTLALIAHGIRDAYGCCRSCSDCILYNLYTSETDNRSWSACWYSRESNSSPIPKPSTQLPAWLRLKSEDGVYFVVLSPISENEGSKVDADIPCRSGDPSIYVIDDRSTVTTMVGTGFASCKGSGRESQGIEQRWQAFFISIKWW